MTAKSWRGDLLGGVSAALGGLPVELVYGLFAVAPLGAAYADQGLRAALWGCVLGGVLGFLFRTSGGMITGSRPAAGLILGTLAGSLLQQPAIQAIDAPASFVFLLLLLCTSMAGVFQLLFGLARVGRSLKYVPYPVVAGLMCGVALLMILSAIRPMLGLDRGAPWSEALESWHPLSVLITAATLAICMGAPRKIKRLPGPVTALIAGTALYHLAAFFLGAEHLGPTSANASGLWPEFSLWQALGEGKGATLITWLPTLVPYALAIAAFASLESLLCLAAIESAKHERADGDRELTRLGVVNMCAGILGATPNIGNLSRVMANLSAGGRSSFSGVAYAASVAIIVLLAGQWLSLVPSAVTAGILMFYALAMIDDGTRRLLVQVLSKRQSVPLAQYTTLRANLGVIVLVALVACIGGMMQALAVGVVAAMFLFVKSNMKPVIRRVYSGQMHRSLKVRGGDETEKLAQEGGRIVGVEIDGPIFFGTADRAGREIEEASQGASWVILDLSRVSDMDTTGARTLARVAQQLAKAGKTLLLCSVDDRLRDFFAVMGLSIPLQRDSWYGDADAALEKAEDDLLAELGVNSADSSLALGETTLATGLSEEQTRILEGYLAKQSFTSSQCVFRQGDAGDSLYVACGGIVDILVPLKGGRSKRVASLAPGIVFGEMALLEGKPRSADAVTRTPCTVWELTKEGFEDIRFRYPDIASAILLNLSRSLAHRVRTTTAELSATLEAA